ncbi:MAG: hypothetical protein JOZ69_05675 [Myxococcales bacterium]|nr:hypothetical protein [Myxococcales bacterium]
MTRRRLVLAWLLALAAFTGCRPSTIAEAEAKHDVRWLDELGTPDAVAAIGRIADVDPKGVTALEARSSYDAQAFAAAWTAVVRDAPWGGEVLRRALADPKRADLAAGAMPRADARLAGFLADLESALVRIAAGAQNLNVATALASVGPAAHDAVARRVVDAATRGAMCRGIGSKQASADARKVLLAAPQSARDSAACVDAVVRIAADDEATLGWVAVQGEPGLLGAAGRSDTLPCPRLHVAWTKALAQRPAGDYPALTVPLGYAVKRCTEQMDGVLADALVHLPATRSTVVEAIDPFGSYGTALHATCATLPSIVAAGRDPAIVRERASDAINHACRPPV